MGGRSQWRQGLEDGLDSIIETNSVTQDLNLSIRKEEHSVLHKGNFEESEYLEGRLDAIEHAKYLQSIGVKL